jgi:probable HAF family extracellular repeat protein
VHLPPSRLPALLAAFFLSIPGVARAGSYRPVDLGTLGGTTSGAHALSSNGLVAGESTLTDGTTHAFLWRDGRLLDLGVLPDGTYSVALGVNAAGVVVGYGDVGDGIRRAFRWTDAGLADLGLLPGGTYSVARGINNAGTSVGEADMDDAGRRRTRAVRFDGTPLDLGIILGSATSAAAAVNAAGAVVGSARVHGAIYHAFRLVSPGHYRDIGALAEGSSDGYAINASGQVVGASAVGADIRAFVSTYRNGRPTALPGLGGPNSVAFGINAAGDIVGSADDANVAAHAVRWRDGQVLDLTTALPADSRWHLTDAAAINDAGQIAGTGTIDGRLHAAAPDDIAERRRTRLVRLTARAQGALTTSDGSDLRGSERRRLRPRLAALLRALRRASDAGDAQAEFADRIEAFTLAARGRLRS